MKSLFLAGQILLRRDCKFNDKSTVVLLPFRPKDENSSRLFCRWSLTPKCLLVLALLGCLLLTSCNSGGGSMSAGGGIDGTGIMSSGVVSAIGSIIVNGTEFDTSEAAIFINGEEIGVGDDVVRDNLDIGKVVTVEGRISADGSSVIADRVMYTNNVAGPVESISSMDATTKEIVVLGQTVIVNVITNFEPDMYGFDSIAMDDVVEVSGYVDDNRIIRATFIADITNTNILELEVTGFVENLDTDSETFKINDLTVDYSSINPSDLPEDFRNDLFIEVGGVLDDTSGELIATAIELADELGGEDGDEFEIMGFVTDFVSAFEFTTGNQEVIADADTVLIDEPPGGIQPGVKLEAEGSLEGGILFAWEIEFWKPDQIEVEGLVTNIVSASEFNIGIQKVQIIQDTIFEGGDRDDLALGVRLEVKGVPVYMNHSTLIADKVSFEPN